MAGPLTQSTGGHMDGLDLNGGNVMDGVYGDVVACLPVGEVGMNVNKGEVKVSFLVPETDVFVRMSMGTDFDTARRMVEGEVSMLVVVSDGGE